MTTQRINPELFEKLVGLAALELSPEQAAYLYEEMNHQLASVEALSQIPLPEDVEVSPSALSRKLRGPQG